MDTKNLISSIESGMSKDYSALIHSISKKYEIESWPSGQEVIVGGEGYVFLAKDMTLDYRKCVLKIPGKIIREDKSFLNRFFRGVGIQARLASLLRKGIPVVYECGESYYSMEYIRGQDFLKWSCEKERKDKEIYAMFCHVLLMFQIIHEFGIIHRDIKPENIIISKDYISRESTPFIIDWGLSKGIDKDSETLTSLGACMGTAGFQSGVLFSDAARASPLDDIYSLGRLLYCLIRRKRFRDDMEFELDRMEHLKDNEMLNTFYKNATTCAYTTCLQFKRSIESELNIVVSFDNELIDKMVHFIFNVIDLKNEAKK